MKRQHPDNPDLFWCPKCQTYKPGGEFHANKLSRDNVDWKCIECSKKSNFKKREYAKTHAKERECYRREYVKRNKEKIKDRVTKYRQTRLEHLSHLSCRNQKKYTDELRNIYVVAQLKQRGSPITPETIELKRQQIIMKRTLKKFKEWRKGNENESEHERMDGEQRNNEAVI